MSSTSKLNPKNPIPPSKKEDITMSSTITAPDPQQQAMTLGQVLNKLPNKILDDENFPLWSSFIRTGLKSYFLAGYLKSDTVKIENSQFNDEVCRAVITTWMLGNMDDVNRSRFEPKITIYTTEDGPETQDLPAKLWKAVNEHHSSRSEELKLLLERSLNLIVQPVNLPLLSHIENFQTAVTKYKTAGGQMSDEDLGRKLLISLNNRYFQNAKEIAILGIKEYDKVVSELKKRLDAVAMLTRTPTVPHQTTVVQHSAEASAVNNSFSRNKFSNKCTKKRCTGINHSPDQCFKKPGNKHLQREWIEQRVKLGQWNGEPPKNLSSSSASAMTLQEPTIEELEQAFNAINPSASHVSLKSLSSKNSTHKSTNTEVLIVTAASHHMFKDKNIFSSYINTLDKEDYLDMAGGNATLKIHGRGEVKFIGPDGHIFELKNCLHIPDLKRSLIGGTILLKDDYITTKEGSNFTISKDGKCAFTGALNDGINLLCSSVIRI